MELYFSGLSDVGNVRPNNEDYLYGNKLKNGEYLFIVADGMGGHNAGEVASRKAVCTFARKLEKHNGKRDTPSEGVSMGIGQFLRRIVYEVNDNLVEEGRRTPERRGMGTTLSVLYIRNGKAFIVHVGDSRIYRYTPGESPGSRLEQLTEDHSFVGRLVKDGFISEEDARNHPKRNVLYQSIGLKNDLEVELVDEFPVKPGEKYLLCSDGLHGVVSDKEIIDHMADNSTAHMVEQLVKRAKANGGPDNISVLVVSTEKDQGPADSEVGRLTDTVKMIDPPAVAKLKKKKRILLQVLLTLSIILLVLLAYVIISDAGLQSAGLESLGNTPAAHPVLLLNEVL